MKPLIVFLLLMCIMCVVAESEPLAVIAPPEGGSVSLEEGLLAFQRIYEVVSHPRCANCHVGADNIPMWSGPSLSLIHI